jgi:L-rhamnose mutarotase
MSRRHVLTCDLKDDPRLIAEYRRYHEAVWPEILRSIKESDIESMEIYLLGNRLVMIMEVSDTFRFDAKAAADRANPKVQEWEELMWNYQQALPTAKPGEKWILNELIFKC